MNYIGLVLLIIGVAILVAAILHSLMNRDRKLFQRIKNVMIGLPEYVDMEKILQNKEIPIYSRIISILDGLIKAKRFEAAQEIAELSLEHFPKSSEVHTRLGMIFLRQNNFTEAEKHFLAALASDPNDIHAANNLAYIYNFQKRYKETIALLEPLLELNNENAITLVNLGIAYFHTNEKLKSYKVLHAAYKIAPRMPEIHFYMSYCLREFNENEKADLAYKRYLVLSGQAEKDARDAENPIVEETIVPPQDNEKS